VTDTPIPTSGEGAIAPESMAAIQEAMMKGVVLYMAEYARNMMMEYRNEEEEEDQEE